MHFHRRRLLRVLSLAFGSNVLLSRVELGAVAQTAAPSPATATEKEEVTGIGGFFFRAHDPDALAKWYQQHLGVSLIPTSHTERPWQQEAGPTAFSPFPQTTGYFGDPQKDWMINFRVRSLDRMAAQLTAAGIPIKIDPQTYPNGRFGRLHDPDGNPIELWEPKTPR